MINVLFTVDTEVWCNGWGQLDRDFPDAFRAYVHGPTSKGDWAIPGLLRILDAHGLKGIFHVESLFSKRFGLDPLAEIVGLVGDGGHEVQLHLHPEWVDECAEPLGVTPRAKTPNIRDFSLGDQTTLLQVGLAQLAAAGAPAIEAFRAGSYALNTDTLRALAANGICKDTSYNLGYPVGVADVAPGQSLHQPATVEGVDVYPVTAFHDGGGATLRHLQLTACSFAEMRHVLEEAERAGFTHIVIVAHNFELLTPDKRSADPVMVRRFDKLCGYLAANADRFRVCGFNDLERLAAEPASQPRPPSGTALLRAGRFAEQALREVNAKVASKRRRPEAIAATL